MRIYQLGYPGNMGGANTECWHTVKLWRSAGWEVHLVPTWGSDSEQEVKLAEIGIQTHYVEPERLADVPGLAGSVVVGMCNSHFQRSVPRLRELGCKLVWVNCMCFQFEQERTNLYRFGPLDAYVFQSHFQRERLEALLARFGYTPDQGFLIRGALDPTEFPFEPAPHGPGEPFTIGRLARPDADKWSSNLWPILQGVPYDDRRALVMGWNAKLSYKCGEPPEWAEALEPQSVPVRDFLGRCHVMLGLNGGALENWPRVGLEAMAAGVPLVVQNAWGWREMIEHEKSGFLCSGDKEFQYWLAYLARNEARRLEVAEAARARLERLCASPPLVAAWRRCFEFAKSHTPKPAPLNAI